jgi:hypothetical protein
MVMIQIRFGHRRCEESVSIDPLLLSVFVIGVGIVSAIVVVMGWRVMRESIADEIAIEQVSDMLAIAINNGSIDSVNDWSDLVEEYRLTNPGYNNYSLDELRQRVVIDFSAFKNHSSNHTQVIWSTSESPRISNAEQVANERLRLLLSE